MSSPETLSGGLLICGCLFQRVQVSLWYIHGPESHDVVSIQQVDLEYGPKLASFLLRPDSQRRPAAPLWYIMLPR